MSRISEGDQMTEYNNDNSYMDHTQAQNPSGRAIAAFVLGIVSVVLCVVPFMLIAAVVGLTLENESERMGYHSLQTPAKVLCILGIVLCGLAIAAIIILVFVFGILAR